LCFLLGIGSPKQLINHPLRGSIFENYVVCEVLKTILNKGEKPHLSFFRDHQGHEVDLIVEHGDRAAAVEIKSGMTIAEDFFAGLKWFMQQDKDRARPGFDPMLIYGGAGRQNRRNATVLPWFAAHEVVSRQGD